MKNTTTTNYHRFTIEEPGAEPWSYPIDLAQLLALRSMTASIADFPQRAHLAGDDPTLIVQEALAQWNSYCATGNEAHRQAFLAQAQWLIEHVTHIGDADGWPIALAHTQVPLRALSALVQGLGLSVIARAYQLTQRRSFLQVAQRVVRTFERDILDGGVCAPVGREGIFFEELAVYPASHTLAGCIFALLGLFDYTAITGDMRIEQVIGRGLATLHTLLDEFDTGFWTRADLLSRRLASPSDLALQAILLQALASRSHCKHCSALASHWQRCQRRWRSRLHYIVNSNCTKAGRALLAGVQRKLFPKPLEPGRTRVCLPVYGFPVTGGTRAVLSDIAQTMRDVWQLEYLAQRVNPHTEEMVIHRFGTKRMAPWQFPAAWLYVLAGLCKLTWLLHRGAGYRVIMPQDGVYSATFSSLVGKLAGVRVVCMDHGGLMVFDSPTFREECIRSLATSGWSLPRRLFARMRYVAYWPSLRLFARVGARFVDHYLIPGMAGDGAEEQCRQLRIPASRITRFASMIDANRYAVLEGTARANARRERGIAADAIVIAMVCRLAPEKGIDIALESIRRALSTLSSETRSRIRVAIAGDGPLRKQVEQDIRKHGLSQTCLLLGELASADVISLLGTSDIFLYTSTRGACLSMAILEAMAAGCAVVASTLPMANVQMLAEGRGICVPPGDAEQTSKALLKFVNDSEFCRKTGCLARDYVAVQHNAIAFKRVLMRATYWSELEEMLDREGKTGAVAVGGEEEG